MSISNWQISRHHSWCTMNIIFDEMTSIWTSKWHFGYQCSWVTHVGHSMDLTDCPGCITCYIRVRLCKDIAVLIWNACHSDFVVFRSVACIACSSWLLKHHLWFISIQDICMRCLWHAQAYFMIYISFVCRNIVDIIAITKYLGYIVADSRIMC